MTALAPNETLYQLRRGQEETGPFTLAQLRSMWLSGAITADMTYRFDSTSHWQPLILLRRLLEPASSPATTPGSSSPSTQPGPNLVLPIVSLVLAFIPILNIAGIVCGHISLMRRRTSNDSAARTLAIIALVIGYVMLLQFALAGSVLFKPQAELPDFHRMETVR